MNPGQVLIIQTGAAYDKYLNNWRYGDSARTGARFRTEAPIRVQFQSRLG